jgi:hypothetical protein
VVLDETSRTALPPDDSSLSFRARPIMRQRTASSIPEAWERYRKLESARAAVTQTYHDDRVRRVVNVTNEVPPLRRVG